MNSQFTEEQIRAYAAQFRVGDAIWSGGEWCEVVEYGRFDKLATKKGESKNGFIVNHGEDDNFEGGTKGFNENSLVSDRYRVTTLKDYELQGGEKIVWLGESDGYRTFGKVYGTHNDGISCVVYKTDKGFYINASVAGNKKWGIIPRYEQVKCSADVTKKEPKFKVGDTVKLNAHKAPSVVKKIEECEAETYIYLLEQSGKIVNFWEAESDLELYEEEKEDDKMFEIKVVEESKYTGKFKVGDEVKVVGFVKGADNVRVMRRINEVGIIARVDKNMTRFNYVVSFNDDKHPFNEAELELVSKRKDDSMDALQYVAKLCAEATSKSATHVSDGMLKLSRTSDEVDRPASSHYVEIPEKLKADTFTYLTMKLSDEEIGEELHNRLGLLLVLKEYKEMNKLINIIEQWQAIGTYKED